MSKNKLNYLIEVVNENIIYFLIFTYHTLNFIKEYLILRQNFSREKDTGDEMILSGPQIVDLMGRFS